jgi:hypothetical protein
MPNWPESNTCSDTSNMSQRVLKQRTRINRITRITTGVRKGATSISRSSTGVVTELLVLLQVLLQY